MYLKQLTITGFKSFAHKTVLGFEPGISAVVGPNGSGKSNVADAVRWVLGEQSSKSLRTKKGEEVIFAGTEKRAKASMAEVSLLLDNADNAVDLDFSEIELSRRLYRSGESEYRLNGRKVTLRDIQHLLIQAGFGPNSYSVIGQGMIDQLILASPAERKLLFGEASGIRGYELKREQALRKLAATDLNLERVHDILSELEPRLKTLERGAEIAKSRQKAVGQLSIKRAELVTSGELYYRQQFDSAQQAVKALQQQIATFKELVSKLEAEKADLTERPTPNEQFGKLHELEAQRDQITNELSVKRAELQFLIDKQVQLEQERAQTAQTQTELASAKRHRQQLARALAEAQVNEAETSSHMAIIAKTIDRMQSRLAGFRRQIDQTSRQEYIDQALHILKQVNHNLGEATFDQEEMRLLVYKAGRLLSHASRGQAEVASEMRLAQTDLMASMKQREEAHEPYTNAVITVRSLELDLAHAEDEVAKLQAISESTVQQKKQLTSVESQVAQRRNHIDQLEQELVETNLMVQNMRQEVAAQTAAERDTEEIFGLASRLQAAKSDLERSVSEKAVVEHNLHQAQAAQIALVNQRKSWFPDGRLPEVGKELAHPAELEQQIALLEARLDDTRDSDGDVLDEYDEASKRYQFLSAQVTDLTAAQADLLTVTGDLDKLIRNQFETAFAELGQHFEKYFKQLFDGGRASLTLTPDSTGAYGIEIKAVPPGKRVEQLSTLSGGERALTGTALLAAILTINPSPFVMLDEIDAALDEANSDRLSKILANLTKHSQLLVITHNRQIMATAGALYGVTMDHDHASKVLSVKLEAATEMAARG